METDLPISLTIFSRIRYKRSGKEKAGGQERYWGGGELIEPNHIIYLCINVKLNIFKDTKGGTDEKLGSG